MKEIRFYNAWTWCSFWWFFGLYTILWISLWFGFQFSSTWDKYPVYPGQHIKFLLTSGNQQTGVTSFQSALYTDHTQFWSEPNHMNLNASLDIYQFRFPPSAIPSPNTTLPYVERFDVLIASDSKFSKTMRLVYGSRLRVQTNCTGEPFTVCVEPSSRRDRKTEETCTHYVRNYDNTIAIPNADWPESINEYSITWETPSDELLACSIVLSYQFQRYDLNDGIPVDNYEVSNSLGFYLVLVNPSSREQLGFSYRIHSYWIWERPGVWWGIYGGIVMCALALKIAFLYCPIRRLQLFLKPEETPHCMYMYCCCGGASQENF